MYELKPSTVERVLEEVGVAAVPGEKIQVVWGDTVRIKATIQYRGNALDDYFYGSIGKKYLGIFDEVLVAQVPVHFAQSLDFVPYNLQVDIPITTDIGIGTNYDIYVKLRENPGAGMPEVDNCIDVVGKPEFQNFMIVSYEKVAGP